jgi:hypothetical protein
MNDKKFTLTVWAAVPRFLKLAVTQVLTAVVMSLPITWLVNYVYSANSIHAIFASARLAYWRCVGIFAIWFAATARIKWTPTVVQRLFMARK